MRTSQRRQCNSTTPDWTPGTLHPAVVPKTRTKKNKSAIRGVFFRPPNSHHQRTTIHHNSTTNSPSKNHVLPNPFSRKGRKNAVEKNTQVKFQS
jgi:hypothetical protein